MRETLVIHSRLSWRQVRGVAAIERQHGLQVLAIEHLAARLAGGFLQLINSDCLKEAIGDTIATDLGEFNDYGMLDMLAAELNAPPDGSKLSDAAIWETIEGRWN